MKKMSQIDFDKYIILDLIPELEDEFGKLSNIVLLGKGKFKFAKECEECHNLVLLDTIYDMPKEITKVIGSDPSIYLETLTGLDIVNYEEIDECECFDDEIDDPGDDYEYSDDYNEEELEEDYSDDDFDEY